MALDMALDDITARLRQKQFPNEQALSQGIVLRLLHEPDWNSWVLRPSRTKDWAPEIQKRKG